MSAMGMIAMMLNQILAIKKTGKFTSTIELLKDKDLQEALYELARYISKATGFKVMANIYEGIGLNGRKSIYCDFEGMDIPFRLYLEIITSIKRGPDLFIIDFNLPGEMRGQGLGSRIICHLLGIVSTFGVKKITLNPVNSRAANFWTKFGFKKVTGKKLMVLDLRKSRHVAQCTLLLFNSLRRLTA
ncbi:MAG: GNAT family N-acetyltransferase [Bacillota bacterium]